MREPSLASSSSRFTSGAAWAQDFANASVVVGMSGPPTVAVVRDVLGGVARDGARRARQQEPLPSNVTDDASEWWRRRETRLIRVMDLVNSLEYREAMSVNSHLTVVPDPIDPSTSKRRWQRLVRHRARLSLLFCITRRWRVQCASVQSAWDEVCFCVRDNDKEVDYEVRRAA